jgi:hypothetical protein
MGFSLGALGLLLKGEFTDLEVGRELLKGLAVGCTAYTLVYALCARRIKESKRRSWIPTCITGTVSSITGLMVAANTIQNHWTGFGTATANNAAGQTPISFAPEAWNESALTKLCCVSFLSFLVVDVVIGAFHYAKHFHILEGWVHHAVYIGFLAETYLSHQTGIFAHFALEEIPTFILGFGTIFPQCRSDNWFGFTFFLTRILWHFTGTFNAHMCPEGHAVRSYTWFGFLSMLLHLNWFFTWCKKYLFKTTKKDEKKE